MVEDATTGVEVTLVITVDVAAAATVNTVDVEGVVVDVGGAVVRGMGPFDRRA